MKFKIFMIFIIVIFNCVNISADEGKNIISEERGDFNKVQNDYFSWDNFVDNFDKEIGSAEDVYNNMKESGLKDYSLAEFDFHFLSNNKEKLLKLNEFLIKS